MHPSPAWFVASFAILLSCAPLAPTRLSGAEPKRLATTFENVAYGPHERNVLDLWQAPSDRPTPLLIFIHGGGFVNGDKKGVRGNPELKHCLEQGVSFASINYRFRDSAPIQDILRDAARAVQFIRSKASDWNIDRERIASYGGSAGAGTSLWLAFHDDLADSKSDDPVLRESSRLRAAGSLNGQVSYDLRDWEGVVGHKFQRSESELLSFYGFASEAEMKSPAGDRTMKDCSMIGLISADDPAVAVACSLPADDPQNRGDFVHHPKHSIALAERCKQMNVPCLLVLHADEPDRVSQSTKVVTYLLEKLGKTDASPASK